VNENPLHGSFTIDELTDLLEEAVLTEFHRISERGGVHGAMEAGYQSGRIQDESMRYEQCKHNGLPPVSGVTTFRNPDAALVAPAQLARPAEDGKKSQLRRVRDETAPGKSLCGAGGAQGCGLVPAQSLRRPDRCRPGMQPVGDHPKRSSRSAISAAATFERA
jgi:hypothetical protein